MARLRVGDWYAGAYLLLNKLGGGVWRIRAKWSLIGAYESSSLARVLVFQEWVTSSCWILVLNTLLYFWLIFILLAQR